ncbi:MAG: hypothetical protein R2856_08405 [Caldilineaceae bacterium]
MAQEMLKKTKHDSDPRGRCNEDHGAQPRWGQTAWRRGDLPLHRHIRLEEMGCLVQIGLVIRLARFPELSPGFPAPCPSVPAISLVTLLKEVLPEPLPGRFRTPVLIHGHDGNSASMMVAAQRLSTPRLTPAPLSQPSDGALEQGLPQFIQVSKEGRKLCAAAEGEQTLRGCVVTQIQSRPPRKQAARLHTKPKSCASSAKPPNTKTGGGIFYGVAATKRSPPTAPSSAIPAYTEETDIKGYAAIVDWLSMVRIQRGFEEDIRALATE